MGAGAVMTYFLPVGSWGIKTLDKVETGLPKWALPDFSVVPLKDVITVSLSVAVVILAETLLAENNFAQKNGYKIDDNQEILAFSVGNLLASLTGCCPINGSVSRTAMGEQYQGKTQLMGIVAGISMMALLLCGTGFIGYLPVPVLTAIVISALAGATEFELAARLWKVSRTECLIFAGAFMGVLFLGTINGVLIGIILSFSEMIIRTSKPARCFLGIQPGHRHFCDIEEGRQIHEVKGVVIYRFSSNLFFANVSTFLQDIENAIKDDTKVVIVDASGIGSIDITAADRLVSFNKLLKDKGIHFYITEHVDNVNDQLRKLGAGCLVEEGVTRRTISLALRDAGVDRPYPLVGTPEQTEVHKDFIEDNERLAEIEWAFGEDASEWLDKFAVQMTDDITHMEENSEHLTDNVLIEAESKNAWGRIGLFDEDELLERVEMHLSELAQNNSNAEELEERIEERRLRLEAKIAKLNPDALTHLRQHRKEVMLHFKENNPEAYKHMMERRMEHISKLEKEKPELAVKMKKLYKLDDVGEDYIGDKAVDIIDEE